MESFLAALGLYGLAAFLVAHRTREISIRMALGASQTSVRSLVLSEAARLGALGTLIGVGLALLLGRALANLQLLVGIKSTDPVTFVALVLQMALVLFTASYLPCAASRIHRPGNDAARVAQLERRARPPRPTPATSSRSG